jgi:hypothetical protein
MNESVALISPKKAAYITSSRVREQKGKTTFIATCLLQEFK